MYDSDNGRNFMGLQVLIAARRKRYHTYFNFNNAYRTNNFDCIFHWLILSYSIYRSTRTYSVCPGHYETTCCLVISSTAWDNIHLRSALVAAPILVTYKFNIFTGLQQLLLSSLISSMYISSRFYCTHHGQVLTGTSWISFSIFYQFNRHISDTCELHLCKCACLWNRHG